MLVTNRRVSVMVVALLMAAGQTMPSLAQTSADIDFGDDTSQWANDGECDDPRFAGSGSAAQLEEADRGKDATDCRTAFEAGTVTLAETVEVATDAPANAVAAVEFGDDTSEWSKDGECDDPRFVGTGMASELVDEDILRDATDCKALFDAGSITLAETQSPGMSTMPTIDFGDDSSNWAKDGECDDPRFAGAAMAVELEDVDIGRDATDCRSAYEAGTITLVGDGDPTMISDIDFGDDSGEWARDLECDDPRFAGSGMASDLSDANIMKDASDCRTAYEDGTITLADGTTSTDQPPMTPVSGSTLEALAARIDFGDDSGTWANDGECDDPDFIGSGVAPDPSGADRMKDASDCRAAFLAGTAALKSGTEMVSGVFDFGADTSEWANDGQCDDWRFAGTGMAKKLSSIDVQGDASDCQALVESGAISIKPVFSPDYVLNAPFDVSGIDFGDNDSPYANDNICDDPRFEGPGAAATLLESDREHDATDCQTLFEEGKITLR